MDPWSTGLLEQHVCSRGAQRAVQDAHARMHANRCAAFTGQLRQAPTWQGRAAGFAGALWGARRGKVIRPQDKLPEGCAAEQDCSGPCAPLVASSLLLAQYQYSVG